MKKIILVMSAMLISGCAQLEEAIQQLPEGTFANLPGNSNQLSDDYIAAGLRAALDQGIEKQVSKLTQPDGFLKTNWSKYYCHQNCKKLIAAYEVSA